MIVSVLPGKLLSAKLWAVFIQAEVGYNVMFHLPLVQSFPPPSLFRLHLRNWSSGMTRLLLRLFHHHSLLGQDPAPSAPLADALLDLRLLTDSFVTTNSPADWSYRSPCFSAPLRSRRVPEHFWWAACQSSPTPALRSGLSMQLPTNLLSISKQLAPGSTWPTPLQIFPAEELRCHLFFFLSTHPRTESEYSAARQRFFRQSTSPSTQRTSPSFAS